MGGIRPLCTLTAPLLIGEVLIEVLGNRVPLAEATAVIKLVEVEERRPTVTEDGNEASVLSEWETEDMVDV